MTEATAKDALKFIAHLKERSAPDGSVLSDNTVRNRFHCLHAFYTFLVDMKLAEHNPFRAVKRAISWRQRIQKRPTKLIPFQAVKQILDSPDARTKEGIRDVAMLALWFGCGLRRSELRGLNVGDVLVGMCFSKEGEEIYVLRLGRTKAGKRQEQPIPNWAWPFLSTLVSQRKSEDAEAKDPLFVFYYKSGGTGERLSESTVYRIYKEHTQGAAPHSARATFATQLARQGKTLGDIASALRHSSPAQAETYIKIAKGIEENKGREVIYFPVDSENLPEQ